MDSFGAYLKAHREKKGIRLEEIASITKIHLHALELLEGGKWEQLPPEPFIRGFIIAYAKYVGLAPTEVLDRYREATGTTVLPDPSAPATTAPPMGMGMSTPSINASPTTRSTPNDLITQVRLPSGPKMITAASLIAVIGLAALLINVGRESEQPAIPTQVTMTPETPQTTAPAVATAPVPEERKVAVSADPVTKPVEAPPAELSGAPAHEVVVEGKERTWLKVVIDDGPPTEYFLAEGKSATYKAMNKIKVVLGNSTGSRVLYNGQEVDGKQFMGTIRSYKFPANARFPQDVPSKRTSSTGAASTEAAGTPATTASE